MRARYTAATVFLDHYSGLSYVHMQRDQTIMELMKSEKRNSRTSQELMESEWEFMQTNNGRFADNAFIGDEKNHCIS